MNREEMIRSTHFVTCTHQSAQAPGDTNKSYLSMRCGLLSLNVCKTKRSSPDHIKKKREKQKNSLLSYPCIFIAIISSAGG